MLLKPEIDLLHVYKFIVAKANFRCMLEQAGMSLSAVAVYTVEASSSSTEEAACLFGTNSSLPLWQKQVLAAHAAPFHVQALLLLMAAISFFFSVVLRIDYPA